MRKIVSMTCMLLLCIMQVVAQEKTVTGKVTDESGAPIPNASVIVKGTSIGTTTKTDGTFSISVPSTGKVLVFSSIGMTSMEVNIGSKSVINQTMTSENKALEEVVVVGYQTVRRKDVIGAVTSVAGKEIAQKPIVNFTQLLQGKAPGMNVIGEGGRPGAGAFIRIRGVGSINASSEPLIIVDGIQIASTAFAQLNPNDIEDISVLKDASASAIYGSRAANGVLVVTTKRGRGKPEVRYSFQYGQSDALDPLNVTFMTAQQKLQYEFERGYTNPYLSSLISRNITAGNLPAGSTLFNINAQQRQSLHDSLISKAPKSWKDVLLPTAQMKQHEVSISGSGDKFRYYMSLNKSDNEGVMYGSYYNRTGGRLNVEYQATDWFKTGVNLALSHSKEDLKRELYNSQSSYTAWYLTNPYEPVRNANGTYNLTMQGFSPLEGADNNPNVLDRISTYATLFGEVKIMPDLFFKTQLGSNYNTLKGESYLKPGSNLAAILGYNQKNDYGNFDWTYVITNTLNYKKSIQKHNIGVLLGQEFNKNKFYSYSLTSRNFASASLTTLENASTPTVATTSRADWALISYFANASYDFDKKYFLSVSGRNDGSSRFGVNNRYANFWSVGAAWDVMQEQFMANVPVISTLKLKGSYGTGGNNNIGNYEAQGTYALNVRYNDLPAAAPARLPNPNLTWETNRTLDIGTEIGLFKNRLNITADYFVRKTEDLLYSINVSQTTGFGSYTGNIGNLENKGIELSVGGDVIRKGGLVWNVSANYTFVDNKVTSLYSDNVPFGFNSRLKVGQPIGTYFMTRWAEINPQNGKNVYYNLSGAKTETYSAGDAVLLEGKSPNVKYFGSINTSLSYKGFDLSAQFYYSGGNYIYNFQYTRGAYGQSFFNTQLYTDAFNYWKKPGDVVKFPNITDASQATNYTTDLWLEKGDYIALRDVTLSYTTKQDLLSKIKVKSVRLFVQGTNLWIGTKFKGVPEVGQSNRESAGYPGQLSLFAYPQTRAVTMGFDIRF
ncbi:TonB-dependent receptor [Lacibacter sp.]|uniref:SusC/RagA family TonB-linked outer membrane protein n=1 Tax=Lacibacter sp. TaxID=1915409 RepID=UPI002B4B135A|nr:TonB-dependent receptor [Lacibacter sp.]HLP37385.1 TonB-dependent receptor [Lacibacter sp.]